MKIFLPLPDWITFEEWSKLIEIKEVREHLKLSSQTPTEVAHTFYGVKHPILHIRPWYISTLVISLLSTTIRMKQLY